MINKTASYRKSAKGAEAIATRQHGLAPKLRSMLILVDGKRGVDDLAKLGGVLGEPAELLEQLLAEGFIEEQPGAHAAVTAPAPVAAPAVTLLEAQRFASRRLTALLGPSAEQLCLRLESTRSPQEFNAVVAKAETILRDFGGEKMAQAFAAEMQSHRPGA